MKLVSLFSITLLALVFAGCGSSGAGDIPGGDDRWPRSSADELTGTVERVDEGSRYVELRNVEEAYRSALADGVRDVRVYYDRNTTVRYEGESYRPEQLERGDRVRVRVARSGDRLIAESITVTYDVSNSGVGGASNVYGTVRAVDPSRRTITLDRGAAGDVVIDYDAGTVVELDGRRYDVADLERGDQVEVVVDTIGGGRLTAERVIVTGDARGSGTTWGAADIRGTVRYVDERNRIIEIEPTSRGPAFDPGASVVTLLYDRNTIVEYEGRTYSPANLERGDVVEADVRRLELGRFLATRILVVRDVRSR